MGNLNEADYLLLLLYLSNKQPIKGSVKIYKMMFIFNKELIETLNLPINKQNEYIPYNYGVFSKDIYDQLSFFYGIGFIDIKQQYSEEEHVDNWLQSSEELIDNGKDFIEHDKVLFEYNIRHLGANYVKEEILDKNLIDKDALAKLLEFKNKINTLSQKRLLRYVYTKYPEYTKNILVNYDKRK